ncbi:MAG: hypothetical protein R6U93_04710 [Dehalococcoidia bacterium]
MGNYFRMADSRRIQTLLGLGWSYRRIQRGFRARLETVARHNPRRGAKSGRSAHWPYGKCRQAAR